MSHDPQQTDNVAPAPDTQRAENGLPPLPEAAQFPWQASGRLLDEDDTLITVSARALDRIRLCVYSLNACGVVPLTPELIAAYRATGAALAEQSARANYLLSLVEPFDQDLRDLERRVIISWKTARLMATIAEIAWGRGVIARMPQVIEAMKEMREAVSPLPPATEIERRDEPTAQPDADARDDSLDRLSPDEWLLVDGVLQAISEIPTVHGQVIAYLLGGGWDDPAEKIANLKLRADL